MECLAAIVSNLKYRLDCIHTIHILWIGEDLVVIVTARLVVAHLVPACTAVTRAEEAALPFSGVGDRVDHAWVRRRNRESDAAEVNRRETGLRFGPGFPGVSRPPHS